MEAPQGDDLESISHRCYLREVAFAWELTKETIHLPLACLQGGSRLESNADEEEEGLDVLGQVDARGREGEDALLDQAVEVVVDQRHLVQHSI